VSPHFQEGDGSKWDRAMLINLVARRAAVAVVLVLLTAAGVGAIRRRRLVGAPGHRRRAERLGAGDYLGLALTARPASGRSPTTSRRIDGPNGSAPAGARLHGARPFGLRVTSQTDPDESGRVDSRSPRGGLNEMSSGWTIRPRPSEHALHTQAGFTIGRWEGGGTRRANDAREAGFIRKPVCR